MQKPAKVWFAAHTNKSQSWVGHCIGRQWMLVGIETTLQRPYLRLDIDYMIQDLPSAVFPEIDLWRTK